MKFNCSFTELVEIHKLVAHPKNPNKHTPEQIERLAKIIDFQGQRHPVVVSKLSGFIVAGHGRLQSMIQLGWDKVAVDYQDFENEAQEYAFLVSDNAISEWSSLDLSQINLDFVDLGPELDLEQLGIKDFVVEPIEKFEPQSDEDEVPELKEDPVTKRGDIWLLGNHRLMCGDSTMIDDVERLMNGEKADMVFTDPPYNYAEKTSCISPSWSVGHKDLKNADWDKGFSFKDVLPIFDLVTKNDCAFYICTSHFLAPEIWEYCKINHDFYGVLVWVKPNPMPSTLKYHWTWAHELICYSTKGKPVYNFKPGSHSLSYWEINLNTSGREHPTQKPVEVPERAILHTSNYEDLILDLFLGSGTTMIACEKNNRRCFGMEFSENYCDVALARWQKYTGKKAILESTKQTYDELKAAKHG